MGLFWELIGFYKEKKKQGKISSLGVSKDLRKILSEVVIKAELDPDAWRFVLGSAYQIAELCVEVSGIAAKHRKEFKMELAEWEILQKRLEYTIVGKRTD